MNEAAVDLLFARLINLQDKTNDALNCSLKILNL